MRIRPEPEIGYPACQPPVEARFIAPHKDSSCLETDSLCLEIYSTPRDAAVSAFSGRAGKRICARRAIGIRHQPDGFSGGEKYVPCFLKLVARILKSEPLIFSLLPCRIYALITGLQFLRKKSRRSLPPVFPIRECRPQSPAENCGTSRNALFYLCTSVPIGSPSSTFARLPTMSMLKT